MSIGRRSGGDKVELEDSGRSVGVANWCQDREQLGVVVDGLACVIEGGTYLDWEEDIF